MVQAKKYIALELTQKSYSLAIFACSILPPHTAFQFLVLTEFEDMWRYDFVVRLVICLALKYCEREQKRFNCEIITKHFTKAAEITSPAS